MIGLESLGQNWTGLGSDGRSRVEDSGWGSEGKRLLRTADRQSAAGVFGLVHSTERHVRRFAREWMIHYNRGWPHLSLGPGIPDPEEGLPATRLGTHKIPEGFGLRKKLVLGGLLHEYRLERMVA